MTDDELERLKADWDHINGRVAGDPYRRPVTYSNPTMVIAWMALALAAGLLLVALAVVVTR